MIRRVFQNLALVVFGVLVALLLAEGVARVTWRASPVVAPAEPHAGGLPVLRTLVQLAQRNARGVMPGGAYYRTNSLGVRGPEYSRPAPPGVFRIVVVGDSVTMGANVEERDTYTARLQERLAERHPDRRFEVVNAGLAGLDITHVVQRLKVTGLQYDPELIVYGWTMNDITGPAYRVFDRPPSINYLFWAMPERFAGSRSYLLRVLWPHWISLRELIWPSPQSYLSELRYNYFDNREAWDAFAAQLDRLAEIGASRHVCVAVFLHTSLTRLNVFHPLRAIYDRVAEAARARGMYPVQSLPVFGGHDERTLKVSEQDPHPNAAGHALLAQALLDGIEALPPDCLRPRAHP